MVTDMVGYTALTQHNEKRALELPEERRHLLRKILQNSATGKLTGHLDAASPARNDFRACRQERIATQRSIKEVSKSGNTRLLEMGS